jgi:hypothetical protein
MKNVQVNPKFVNAAQIEAYSKILFSEAVSSNFIINELNQDYFGIDYFLTEYRDGQVIPRMCLAQLKGTAVPGKRWVQLSTDIIRFWNSLPLDVYIYLVNIEDRTVDVIRSREILLNNNKTIRVYATSSVTKPENKGDFKRILH